MADKLYGDDKVWVLQGLGGWYAAYQITGGSGVRTGLAAFRIRDAALCFVTEHFEERYHGYFVPRCVELREARQIARKHRDMSVSCIFYVEEYDYRSPAIVDLPVNIIYGLPFKLDLPPIDYTSLDDLDTE